MGGGHQLAQLPAAIQRAKGRHLPSERMAGGVTARVVVAEDADRW